VIQLIDHIGVVVKDIDSSLKVYTEALGLKLSTVEVNEPYKVKIAFIPVGETLVELIQPTAEGTMISNFLMEKGEGIHHIAFKVDDLEADLAKLKAMGIPLIDEKPQPGGLGARVAFMHPDAANSVSIELLEKKG
jgi:methylmalonyl-CoA/ethylmalonyl-CoA epimerase